jgi:hypothetical protein
MTLFKPSYIMVHHSLTKDSGTVSWQPIRNWHMGLHPDSPYKMIDVGYQYGIELINDKYEILVGRMEGTIGAHTRGMNGTSIGICCIGNFDKNPPDKDQWSLLLKLCVNICLRYNIPADKVKGHTEYAPYKSCPGNAFDMDKFRKDLETELN